MHTVVAVSTDGSANTAGTGRTPNTTAPAQRRTRITPRSAIPASRVRGRTVSTTTAITCGTGSAAVARGAAGPVETVGGITARSAIAPVPGVAAGTTTATGAAAEGPVRPGAASAAVAALTTGATSSARAGDRSATASSATVAAGAAGGTRQAISTRACAAASGQTA